VLREGVSKTGKPDNSVLGVQFFRGANRPLIGSRT
jgi:hypothetical protein